MRHFISITPACPHELMFCFGTDDMICVDPKTNGGEVNFLMAVSSNYSFVQAEQAITR